MRKKNCEANKKDMKISLVKEALENLKRGDPEVMKLRKWAKNYLKQHPEEEYCCVPWGESGNIMFGRDILKEDD